MGRRRFDTAATCAFPPPQRLDCFRAFSLPPPDVHALPRDVRCDDGPSNPAAGAEKILYGSSRDPFSAMIGGANPSRIPARRCVLGNHDGWWRPVRFRLDLATKLEGSPAASAILGTMAELQVQAWNSLSAPQVALGGPPKSVPRGPQETKSLFAYFSSEKEELYLLPKETPKSSQPRPPRTSCPAHPPLGLVT
jgi:hypothetical protein